MKLNTTQVIPLKPFFSSHYESIRHALKPYKFKGKSDMLNLVFTSLEFRIEKLPECFLVSLGDPKKYFVLPVDAGYILLDKTKI